MTLRTLNYGNYDIFLIYGSCRILSINRFNIVSYYSKMIQINDQIYLIDIIKSIY